MVFFRRLYELGQDRVLSHRGRPRAFVGVASPGTDEPLDSCHDGSCHDIVWGGHLFSTDTEGHRYVGEDYVGEDMAFRIQKFVPGKDGNPAQLIGPLM
jgi:hypothetical protein